MGLRGFCGCLDSLDGELEVVDGSAGVAGRVFDGAAGEADGGCEADGFGADFGGRAESVLEVGGDGKVGCFDDLFRVRENSVACQVCGGVLLSDGEGVACAGRGEGFEAEGGEDLCGTGVPWIGDDECSGAFMQRFECFVFLFAGHCGPRSFPF